jgi:hypothetical protein
MMYLNEITDKLQEVCHEGHAEKEVIIAVQSFYKPSTCYELIDPSDIIVAATEDGKVRIMIKR